MNKIIEPNKEYEIKFYNYLKKLKKQIVDEENRTVRTYPSAKEHLEHNLILINNLKLNGYIQNSKLFEEFLGIFDNYDFLFDINNGFTCFFTDKIPELFCTAARQMSLVIQLSVVGA